MGRPSLQRLGAAMETARPRQVKSHAFYVGQPEEWVLVLEHRLVSLQGTWSGQDLSGFLRHQQLDLSHPVECASCFKAMLSHFARARYARTGLPAKVKSRFGPGKHDRRLQVRMSELLEAAGVSLDEECSRCAEFNLTGERARLRRVGLELDVTLFYSNLWFSWRLERRPRVDVPWRSDLRSWFFPNEAWPSTSRL